MICPSLNALASLEEMLAYTPLLLRSISPTPANETTSPFCLVNSYGNGCMVAMPRLMSETSRTSWSYFGIRSAGANRSAASIAPVIATSASKTGQALPGLWPLLTPLFSSLMPVDCHRIGLARGEESDIDQVGQREPRSSLTFFASFMIRRPGIASVHRGSRPGMSRHDAPDSHSFVSRENSLSSIRSSMPLTRRWALAFAATDILSSCSAVRSLMSCR
jgi:hypothetical protein